MNKVDYRNIYDNFLTTDEFIKKVKALEFGALTDMGYNKFRIVCYTKNK